MVSFRITKNGFIGNGSGSLTGSLLGTASHAITASSVAWNDVTGKPSTYPAAAHDHTGDHLKPTSVTTTGDITVGGNLIVNGSQTVIKTKNLTVKDKLIEIASGSTTQTAADGAGIAIQTASAATQEGGEAASARIQYRSSDNHFTASIGFVAPSFTGSLQGNATSATSAEKLSTGNVGGTGEPVYFENGVPVVDEKTKGAVDWVTNNSGSLSTPDEVIWKKGTGIDSVVQVLTGIYEADTPTATKAGAVAIGYRTTASGEYSHAEGYGTIASGLDSHAEGLFTTSSGDDSHAEGQGTNASEIGSHAEGYGTIASGVVSHAEGYGTIASNVAEHAQGLCNHSSENQIFSVGAGETINEAVNRRNAVSVLVVPNSDTQINTASFFVQNIGGYDGTNPTPGTNDLATVIGKVSSIWKKGTGTDSAVRVLTGDNEVNTPSATGAGAVAIGTATIASGYYSHAEGNGTNASGWVSHAEGQDTKASNDASHAEGCGTKASGQYSHAEGENTEASGWSSHAEGLYTNASGPNSHAEGNQTIALGGCSHAEGQSTTASNYFSHTEGFHTVTSNDYEHAQGIANHNSTNQIFSVGAGEKIGETVTRRNALSVLVVPNSETQINTASFFVQNVGGYNGTNPIPGTNDLATVINKIKPNAGTVTSVGVSAGTGITASVTNATTTPKISISSAQAHTHSNKAELDRIASGDVAKWNAKQNAIDDLATIRSKADNGQTAYDWGDHASKGYAKSGDITTAINNLVKASGSKWSSDTKVTSADNHYTPEQAGTSGSSTERYYIKTIGVDSKGHVTSVTTGHETVENTDTKVTSVDNHYKPKQSALKDVIAGSVISGIYLDAAGHVTGVSSSSQINNATIAKKLIGTSGSVDVPVYIDAGVPKTCKANIVSLPIFSKTQAEVQAQSGTITLIPGTVHKCGTLSENLTINLDTGSIGSHEAIYCCVFNMGSILRTITLPAGVKVVENSADLDTVGVYYEINIMNNVAIIARTAAS